MNYYFTNIQENIDVRTPIDHAKGGEYEKCLENLGLPIPTPNKGNKKQEL